MQLEGKRGLHDQPEPLSSFFPGAECSRADSVKLRFPTLSLEMLTSFLHCRPARRGARSCSRCYENGRVRETSFQVVWQREGPLRGEMVHRRSRLLLRSVWYVQSVFLGRKLSYVDSQNYSSPLKRQVSTSFPTLLLFEPTRTSLGLGERLWPATNQHCPPFVLALLESCIVLSSRAYADATNLRRQSVSSTGGSVQNCISDDRQQNMKNIASIDSFFERLSKASRYSSSCTRRSLRR